MGLLAVCSAKGSPGASTLAMGLAALWPHACVLADLDPAGSDLIWRYRDEAGQPLDPDRGVLSLGATIRRTGTEILPQDHLQFIAGGQPVLAGFTHPDQVTGLGPVWPALAEAFLGWPADVIADCGRVVPGSPSVPVLGRADAVVFVVRPNAAAFAQLRERLRALAEPLGLGRTGIGRTYVLVIASGRDRRVGADLQRLLDGDGPGVQVLGVVAEDDTGAAALGGQWNARLSRSLLVRSLRGVLPQLEQALTAPSWPAADSANAAMGGTQ